VKQLPTLARAQLAPYGVPSWRAWLRLRQTHLANEAITFSLFMRWLILLISPLLILFNAMARAETSAIFVIGLLYNLLLSRAAQAHRHPSLLLTALADVVLISTLVFFRGGARSDIYILYTVVLVYLTMAYSWRGTVFALLLSLVCYLPALELYDLAQGGAFGVEDGGVGLLRLLYMTVVGLGVGVAVGHFERANTALAHARIELSDRVRRLEVIQRISRRLQTLTSVEAIGEAVATETRDLISYDSCRVHIWQEDAGGVILPLIGFYGEIPNRDQVPAGAMDLRLGEGIIGWVAAHGEPLLIGDAMNDARAKHIPGTPHAPESLLAVPLSTDTRVKGVIAMGKLGAAQFHEDDVRLLVILANAAGVALENAETRLSLARQARTDAVTGLPHHGPFQVDLAHGLAEADETGALLALLLLDLDGFRSYNERLGVQAGDACLQEVARLLDRLVVEAGGSPASAVLKADGATPPLGAAYRIGGDEFALLLRGPLAAERAVLRLGRRAVQAIAELHAADPLAQVTASAGLAFYPADAPNRQALVDLADAALYLVRQGGGDRLGRADAVARETLTLRHNLEELVQTCVADSGSDSVVQYLIAETSALQRQLRPSGLADRLTMEALRALAAAIDAKDDYTRGHSERVAAIAAEIARAMDCPPNEVDRIATAARMHDIGKIGVPDHLLRGGRALTPSEKAEMARHPTVGAEILLPIHTLADVVPIVRHHHERVDGQGYPEGLRGEMIPFGARVLAVADALDAMVSDRTYRRGMTVAEALAELRRHVGSHFWGPVVETACALYGPDGPGVALHRVAATPTPRAGKEGSARPVPADPSPTAQPSAH
jgi:putative nucleotidyltransferase with HDIG domain